MRDTDNSMCAKRGLKRHGGQPIADGPMDECFKREKHCFGVLFLMGEIGAFLGKVLVWDRGEKVRGEVSVSHPAFREKMGFRFLGKR